MAQSRAMLGFYLLITAFPMVVLSGCRVHVLSGLPKEGVFGKSMD